MTIRKRWTDAPVSSLGRQEDAHTSIHTAQNSADLGNMTSARRRRREKMNGAPVHSLVIEKKIRPMALCAGL